MSHTTIRVRVKPRARQSRLLQQPDGGWQAELKSPLVDGKANRELIGLVARQFGVPKSAVSIRSGTSGRQKLLRIDS